MTDKKNLLDSKGICAIIKVCSQYGVKKFKLGECEIEFGMILAYDNGYNQEKPIGDPVEAQEVDIATREKMDTTTRMEDLEELSFTDPERYEEEIFKGVINAEAISNETE